MHVTSLITAYGLGVKENVKTVSSIGPDGKQQKVKSIITPGGEFKDGERIMKTSRKLYN